MLTRTFLLAVCISVAAAANEACRKRGGKTSMSECCPVVQLIADAMPESCAEFKDAGRRPPPPPPPPPKDEDDNEVEEDGGKRRRGPPRRGPMGHIMPIINPCYAECLLNETDSFSDGEVNESNFAAFLDGALTDNADLVPDLMTAFQFCSGKIEDKLQKRPHRKCGSSWLLYCTVMKFSQTCPASIWKDDEECNNLMELQKQCSSHHEEE